MVFATRHGEVVRSRRLLDAIRAGEPMSPTEFGLSVHNAIAALYSIIRRERGNYTAVAAGRLTAEAAVVEAAGLMADGAAEVLVVVYDAPLPASYASFADEPDPCYAWAWRIGGVADEGERLTLCPDEQPAADLPESGLPWGLDVLRFVLSGDEYLVRPGWRWQRHA